MTPRKAAAVEWLLLALAVFALNAAITFHNRWPTPLLEMRPELSIEIAVLLLFLAIRAELNRPWTRRLGVVLTGVLLAFALGRYAEVTSSALYGRPVNLYWDAHHLPKVTAMLLEVAPLWLIGASLAAAVLLLAAVWGALHWCVARVGKSFARPTMRRTVGAAAALVAGVYVVSTAAQWPLRWYYSVPVTTTYGQQIGFMLSAALGAPQLELREAKLRTADFGHLNGTDVLLVFLESYGAVAYETPEVGAVVAPSRAELGRAIAETGRSVSTAFVTSPTFGGGSWLAHSTFMSGLEVRDQGSYELLVTQNLPTLPKLFKAAGYRTSAWMPGLREAWPEGAFYGFDSIRGEPDIGYPGPDFGWWRIPDQYSLAKLAATELGEEGGAPRFLMLATVNTHIPFRPTPPYQADWGRLLSESPYDADAAANIDSEEPDWAAFRGAYADALAYTYTYLAGFLRERADDDFVLILLGDHQPATSVTGEGARWDVPVHVITRRDAIASALLDRGFVAGLGSREIPAPIESLPELANRLLEVFDSSVAAPRYGSGADKLK